MPNVLPEEIVQDAFVDLLNHWDSIAPAAAMAYLRRAIINRCRSALRRRRTVRAHPLEPPLPQASAESHVLRAAGYELLLARVAALPMRQRQVIVLRYFSEVSIAETAAALDISPAAVTTATHKALRALASVKETLR